MLHPVVFRVHEIAVENNCYPSALVLRERDHGDVEPQAAAQAREEQQPSAARIAAQEEDRPSAAAAAVFGNRPRFPLRVRRDDG